MRRSRPSVASIIIGIAAGTVVGVAMALLVRFGLQLLEVQ